MLRTHGYTVLEAGSDREAIDHASQGVTIHLLLSDHVIPHTSGIALADRLVLLQPHIRVLFMTGYGAEPECPGHQATHAPVLQKPFTPTELLQTVRATLDAGRTSQQG